MRIFAAGPIRQGTRGSSPRYDRIVEGCRNIFRSRDGESCDGSKTVARAGVTGVCEGEAKKEYQSRKAIDSSTRMKKVSPHSATRV